MTADVWEDAAAATVARDGDRSVEKQKISQIVVAGEPF